MPTSIKDPTDIEGEIRRLVAYDPLTGILSWKENRYRVCKGDEAGALQSQGYVMVTVCQRRILAQRLAWFLHYGVWPGQIDHRDTVRTNNRIANLRESSQSQNSANTKRRSNNKSGFKGVSARGKRWGAYITKDYKSIGLGVFDTPEEAHAAYMGAARCLFGKFARAA